MRPPSPSSLRPVSSRRQDPGPPRRGALAGVSNPKMLGCFQSLMKDFKKQIWMQRMIRSFVYAVRQGQWNTAVWFSSLPIVAIDLTYSILIFFNVTTTSLITILCSGESDEQSKPSSNTGIRKASMLLVEEELSCRSWPSTTWTRFAGNA
ncbi:hypothetical protein OsI_36972 [Oryza sativa Indica Group]|uniref:Uncharacterized protein n=1 Tax=Oryza sativa subsp. indica TaxID=39946 RepID=B8BIH1_ORYSI|nr:hypothetical protein OsI_36972 [Oryza sativa Indica Group]